VHHVHHDMRQQRRPQGQAQLRSRAQGSVAYVDTTGTNEDTTIDAHSCTCTIGALDAVLPHWEPGSSLRTGSFLLLGGPGQSRRAKKLQGGRAKIARGPSKNARGPSKKMQGGWWLLKPEAALPTWRAAPRPCGRGGLLLGVAATYNVSALGGKPRKRPRGWVDSAQHAVVLND
jgi:hypothetical protein